MPVKIEANGIIFALLFFATGFVPTGASAITVEVAKKCNALVAKEFPPRVIGNPAAGRSTGTAQSQRDYFKKCVASDGNMEAGTQKSGK